MHRKLLLVVATAAALSGLLGPLAASASTPARPTAAAAPAAKQELVRAQSELRFSGRQLGVPMEGGFRDYNASIHFDPRNPQASRIDFTVQLGSASLGAPEAESELARPAWFDTARFPQARFTSSAVKALGGGRYEIAGELTIKGQRRPVVVPVTLARAGALTTVSGAFVLKRLEFGIGSGDWADPSVVANDVSVRFKFAVTGIPAS